MTRLLLILALATALLAVGCAAQEDGIGVGDQPTTPPDDPASEEPAEEEDGGAASGETLPNPVTGTLDRVDVEGGCAVLVVDGSSYELVAAPGAAVAIDPANGVVADTDGNIIAEMGDTITVTGEIDPGLMSFCQVGPILAAEDVTAG